MAVDSSSNSPLCDLPHELLHQILILLSPSDLASLCYASRRLKEYIFHSEHLWIQLYRHIWDTPQDGLVDAVVSQPCPKTQLLSREKGKQRCIDGEQAPPSSLSSQDRKRLFLDRIFTYSSSSGFDIKEQVQRRVWAEKRLANLRAKPIDLYANYNETMRALLSIARSRKSRGPSVDDEADSSRSSIYLTNLLTSAAGTETFRSVIYPRTDVRRLRTWQYKTLYDKHCKDQYVYLPSSERASTGGGREKRTRTMSNGSSTKEEKRRKTMNGSNPPTRRRSKRLLLHSYPREVHHLLFDDKGNSVMDTEGEVGVTALEELDLIDEQLAAELHVLHGILPHNKAKRKRGRSQAHHREEEEEEQRAESETESSVNSSASDWDADEGLEGGVGTGARDRLACEEYKEPADWHSGRETAAQLRGRAREVVYDNARYGVENDFGPWRAWRERWELIDGDRFEQFEAPMTPEGEEEGEEEEEGGEEEGEGGEEEGEEVDEDGGNGETVDEDGYLVVQDEPMARISLTVIAEPYSADGTSTADEGHDTAPPQQTSGNGTNGIRHATNDPQGDPRAPPLRVLHVIDNDNPDINVEVEEDEDDEDFDEDFEMQDEDDMDEEVIQMRARDIAYSHGLLPYYESERLQEASVRFGVRIPGPPTRLQSPPPDECDEARQLRARYECKALKDVWRIEKAVDWLIVESVMVCMHANISHAVHKHGWGRSVRQLLPEYRSMLNGGQTDEARHTGSGRHSRAQEEKKWQDYLTLPYGWSHSRGDASMTPPSPSSAQASADKPFDWAAVESTWIGTYAFLDWSRWALFNSRSPDKRCWTDEFMSTDPTKPAPRVNASEMHSLQNEPEALGDCLQLQMELLPVSEQRATSLKERSLEWLQGAASTKYPPLRFRGRTVTLDEEPARPRGQIHGMVRPIFAPAGDDFHKREEASPDERAIVALEWTLTHSYDGDERWSLSGVQPGPPGTRAPIYGIWGSSQRNDDLSPHGGFVYYRPGYASQ